MKFSNFRIAASQLVGTLTVNVIKFTTGNLQGFTTIFIGELSKDSPEISVSTDELTWYAQTAKIRKSRLFETKVVLICTVRLAHERSECDKQGAIKDYFSSYFFMLPVGSLLGGFLAQRIGSRIMFMFSSITFILAWLLYYWAKHSDMILVAQALSGLAIGLLKGPGLTFVAEISQTNLRSIFMTSCAVSYFFGQFFPILLKQFLYWRTIVLINLVFPVIGLLMCFFIPNSPYWLASKNRFDDARNSLAWYRGWATPNDIKSELQILESSWNVSFDFSTNTSDAENVENSKMTNRLKNVLKSYLNRRFYIPLATSCFVFFVSALGGTYSVQVFSELLFKKIKSPISSSTTTVILYAIRLVGSLSVFCTIRFTGKRKLLFASVIGCGISFATAAIFNYLIDSNHLVSREYFWIPTISIVLAVFMSAAGIEKIMYFINSEIFPLSHRLIGAGFGETFYNLITSVLNKIFLYLIDYLTVSGIFTLFAATNIIGFITFYFVLPETEGKSLNEIEEHYDAGKRNIENKQKMSKI
ncbi:hypothetical protein TSAR_014831 [Trichomalopsis sarcophagae]|uniref:Major facilitator superfamily (MFS) profile domain-containing protein n=1 Tax=Trichomalopsis sarcophagae TaxID=543379 RepID=A0A232EPN0_9HYME|nr:hypothetical protein TSAR_014831 [Trichomalopsis sarcophagae]